MGKIKIFSTQRIDRESQIVEDNIFTPIRCGAIYDKKESNIIGDDTGDNISHKRNSYCELTTQYWAWKNVDCDYYGFCHYRRYFSFSEKKLDTDQWSTVILKYLNDSTKKLLCLDEKSVYKKIDGYDALIYNGIDLKPLGIKSVYEQYRTGDMLHIEDLDKVLGIIGKMYPEYSEAAREYMQGTTLYLCNMFIMKKELFNDYSEWLFSILTEFEKESDMSDYSEEGYRTPGHLGERLLGIYYTYLKKQNKYKLGELQVAAIQYPWKNEKIEPAFNNNNIPIVMSSSEYFGPYCGTVIQSIKDSSNKEYNYDIIILESELSNRTKDFIKNIVCDHNNFSIRFVDVKSWFENYSIKGQRHISVETYYRLLIPELLDKYDKVLYLDSDIIVLHDVADLYNIELADNYLAGVVDIANAGLINGFDKEARQYCDNELKLKNPLYQFNAGIIVINNKLFKKDFSVKYLLDFAQEGNYRFQDQDVLNILCEGRIKWIEPEWNYFADPVESYRGYVEKFAPKDLYIKYREAKKNIRIIHYAGAEKPWHDPWYEYAEYFWNTLKRTPFYEVIINRRILENGWGIANQTIDMHNNKLHLRKRNIFKRCIRKFAGILLPVGTKRREKGRKLYYKIRGWED